MNNYLQTLQESKLKYARARMTGLDFTVSHCGYGTVIYFTLLEIECSTLEEVTAVGQAYVGG